MKNKLILLVVISTICILASQIIANNQWFLVKNAQEAADILLKDKPFKKDDELIDLFQSKRKTFQYLVELFQQDAHVLSITTRRVDLLNDTNWPRPKNKLGIPEERWSEYKLKLDEVHLDLGISRRMDKDGIFLTCCGSGIAGNGALKGYVYSETELTPLVDSLDKDNTNIQSMFIFKKLDNNWYLYHLRR